MSVLLLTALIAAPGDPQPASPSIEPPVLIAQMSIQRQSVVRIAPAPAPRQKLPSLEKWKEKDAPKCFAVGSVAGILITKLDSLDMLLRGGKWVRARLEKGCPSTDFYSGFYMKPSADGRLCEDRDVIHSRAGGACAIRKFKALVPPKQ